ncbi:MAG: Stf0 family sulfotransferase [Pseudomonadota bacterium]
MTTGAAELPRRIVILCATPRSGSTLLCKLLESSGVAGVPHSYFRRQDLAEWAAHWCLPNASRQAIDRAYLGAAITAGSTPNGVFGLRLMAPTLPELLRDLRHLFGQGGTDLDLLDRAFGRPEFLFLRRLDPVAQAVSRLRAEQTGLWHEPSLEWRRPQGSAEPRYDFHRIRAYLREIEAGNAAWETWFTANLIAPHRMRYEDLGVAPDSVAGAALEYLGLTPLPGRALQAPTQRMADALNAEWIARFKAEVDCAGHRREAPAAVPQAPPPATAPRGPTVPQAGRSSRRP